MLRRDAAFCSLTFLPLASPHTSGIKWNIKRPKLYLDLSFKSERIFFKSQSHVIQDIHWFKKKQPELTLFACSLVISLLTQKEETHFLARGVAASSWL